MRAARKIAALIAHTSRQTPRWTQRGYAVTKLVKAVAHKNKRSTGNTLSAANWKERRIAQAIRTHAGRGGYWELIRAANP